MEFSALQGKVVSSVSAGGVFVDGLGVGDVGVLCLETGRFCREGIFIVVMAIDHIDKKVVSGRILYPGGLFMSGNRKN